MRKAIILLVVAACLPALLSAGIFAKTGTAGLQFLKLGVDARAIGMGEAYTAVTNDISSVYWNPAGLALCEHNQVMFSHTNWPADIMHEFVAAGYVHETGNYAIYGSFLHMDPMDVYTEDDFNNPTGETFNAGDMCIGVVYANSFTDKFSFGMSAKYLREDLADNNVSTLAVDMGSLYNTGWHNLTIGMALRNFGPDLKYQLDNDGDGQTDEDPFDLLDNDGDGLIDEDREEMEFKLPMNFSLGMAADIYRSEGQSLIGSFQLDNWVDRKETWNAGMEYNYGIFSLRTGYMINGKEEVAGGMTFGAGFRVPTRLAIFSVDYAYTDMEYLQESFAKSAHRVSMKMEF